MKHRRYTNGTDQQDHAMRREAGKGSLEWLGVMAVTSGMVYLSTDVAIGFGLIVVGTVALIVKRVFSYLEGGRL